MQLTAHLRDIWRADDHPFLVVDEQEIGLFDLLSETPSGLEQVQEGDVVALAGDYEPSAIAGFLALADRAAIIALLDPTEGQRRDDCLAVVGAQWLLHEGILTNLKRQRYDEPLLDELRNQKKPGLIFFSSGSTGEPKAIVHDLETFLSVHRTPRRSFRSLTVLAFDHLAGFNALMMALFHGGMLVVIRDRSVATVLRAMDKWQLDLLPATPTFLRMLLLSGAIPDQIPSSLKVISYGSERMDQPTLTALFEALPDVAIRQTFGVSELGALKVRSHARDSLAIEFLDDDVDVAVSDRDTLLIKSPRRMLGYLGAAQPFDGDGWYDTGDLVERIDGGYIIKGRAVELINVGGLKCLPSDIEKVALTYLGVRYAIATGRPNPLTGQHVELEVETQEGVFDRAGFKQYLAENLPRHMQPRRIKYGPVDVSHRLKKRVL